MSFTVASLRTAYLPRQALSTSRTSPHRHALLAICAQWVDSNYMLQKALLGLPECRYTHSGEHQAGLILETLERYNIQSRIGYHTGDNATSNDTCLESLESQLLSKYDVEFDSNRRRIRCIAHIINLSLQAFLLASSKEALIAALQAAADVSGEKLLAQFSDVLASHRQRTEAARTQPQERPRRQARRRGSRSSQGFISDEFSGVQNIPALRKLHGLTIWLRSSSIHSDYWDRDVGLRLGIDNTTRWSSWYHVINKAITKKALIIQFMLEHEAAIGDNRFTAADWDLLNKAKDFLQQFASATLYAEGAQSSISQSLFIMDLLLLHYEQQRVKYSSENEYDPSMLRAIEMGWFIIDKYYSKSDETPVYVAALLLDPRKRDAYLKQNWRRDWYESAIEAANGLWEEEFNIHLSDDYPAVPVTMGPPPKKLGIELQRLMKDIEVKTAVSRDVDDFRTFIISQPITIDCTPLQWWCRAEQRQRYPRLSRMAIAILSIPAESSEPERTFSGARRTCSWDRLSLTCNTIQMIECIGNWLREGHIRPLERNGMGLPMVVHEA